MHRATIVSGDRHAVGDHWRFAVYRALADRRGRDGGTNLLIHGAASGIDTIAGRVGDELRYQILPVPAMWDQFDNRAMAGPERNRDMVRIIDILWKHAYDVRVMLFHDDLNGVSTGTANLKRIADSYRLPITLYHSNGTQEVVAW